jgi:RNA polymerase sigma-70 factor (ECF subfamily)
MTGRIAFHEELEAQFPALRGFARTLARDAQHADDLVQETLLKAWTNRARYEPDTNLRAWLFTILRNTFYSEMRKRGREVADVEGEHAQKLVTRPSQDHALAMNDFFDALETLPDDQREALVLIGAAGLTYDEAAEIVGVAPGTIKSRVSRARSALTNDLDVDSGSEIVTDEHMDAVIGATPLPAA